jgi:hypothetical protein
VDGLRLFEAGHYRRAHWHWVFSFQHWGEHATSAIRALFMHVREQGVLDGQGHVYRRSEAAGASRPTGSTRTTAIGAAAYCER